MVAPTLGRRYRARRAVQELMALDDRMLRDVGLGRGDIKHAVRSGQIAAAEVQVVEVAVVQPPQLTQCTAVA